MTRVEIDYGKMNPYVKRKWVKALRSGDYVQSSNALIFLILKERWEESWPAVVGRKYCCLGVLAEEMVPNEIAGYAAQSLSVTESEVEVEVGFPSEFGYIPEELARLWGLTDVAQQNLASFNDAGKSFAFIADWIEENL